MSKSIDQAAMRTYPSGAHTTVAFQESEVVGFVGELKGEGAAMARAGVCRKRHF